MHHWRPLQLTVSSLPVLLEKEFEFAIARDVALYDGDSAKPSHEGGSVRVTSHRILFTSAGANLALGLDILQTFEKHSGFFIHHPKLKLVVAASPPGFTRLSFRSGSIDEFIASLTSAHKRGEWKASPMSASAPLVKPVAFDPMRAGVGAAERRLADMQRETHENLETAFRDIKELKARAIDMVQLAKRISSHLQHSAEAGSSEAEASAKFSSVAFQIGFVSPVTRESAGALYFTELARQLCDLLYPHVRAAHGMLLLADAYCLVNRARGTALLSPDDVRRGCGMFRELQLPLSLR
jgi:ESCRT-II complex subunit VPS36